MIKKELLKTKISILESENARLYEFIKDLNCDVDKKIVTNFNSEKREHIRISNEDGRKWINMNHLYLDLKGEDE